VLWIRIFIPWTRSSTPLPDDHLSLPNQIASFIVLPWPRARNCADADTPTRR
jgi:hypothetical protein